MNEKRLSLGIELGSTRIKSILINEYFEVIANGTYDWENKLINDNWTYDLDDVWKGIQKSIENMNRSDLLPKIESIGVSAMMHGYLAFDLEGELLVPFRTWRNSNTDTATKVLSEALNFNIPHRWSIAHIYQAIMDNEDHIQEIDFFTTLAGYVHWKLTGSKALGIGDASGMFPVEQKTLDYDTEKLIITDKLLKSKKFNKSIKDLLPKCLVAGEDAGHLTKEGSLLLDPSGNIKPNIIMAPPEGDAGTGMIATNAIKAKTGNVSAGTSVFAMIVLEKPLQNVYPEIDIVSTPDGKTVAMAHVNNCTSDLNAWVNLFKELLNEFGQKVDDNSLFEKLLTLSLNADQKDGGLLSYGYLSGENITNVSEGRPLFVRLPEANFNLSNFMSSHMNAAFAALNIGMNTLYNEGISIEVIQAHGGIFKTKLVAQKVLASALKAPISLSSTASEGGAWGMAILANYTLDKQDKSLVQYLDDLVFAKEEVDIYTPTEADIENYELFMDNHIQGLEIERIAAKNFKR